MKQINSGFDFEEYFEEHKDEGAKVRPASEFADAVIDRFYGQGSSAHWVPTGFSKLSGKFDFRVGEVTLWAGVNKHGKTTFLSHVMLNLLQAGQKVCVASMEMKPAESMAKMAKQASAVESPSIGYIRAFHRWTDNRLWIYNHLGRLAARRAVALAVYVRKELGIDHLVIDSLMKCGIGVDDLTGQKDFVDELCSIARDTGLHIHLVCHMRKGENEKTAPDKYAIKGAGEIADMVDNIVIVWKNLKKPDAIAEAERIEDEDQKDQARTKAAELPDSFVRIAGQRNHPWEGGFAFWFDPGTQQYREHPNERASFLDLELEWP